MCKNGSTKEQFLIADTFKLNIQDMFELNHLATSFIFEKSKNILDGLNSKFELFKKNYLI